MGTKCEAMSATVHQYWEKLPDARWKNRATGKICDSLVIKDYQTPVEPPNGGNTGEEMVKEDPKTGGDGKKGGMMEPTQTAIDTTNPIIKGLLEALVGQATKNMANPRAGGNQFMGPTAQLYPGGLRRFDASGVGGPGGPGGGDIERPRLPWHPGQPEGPIRPPGPQLPPGMIPQPRPPEITPEGVQGTQNFSTSAQLLASLGISPEEFNPISSGSRYIRSYQPQYMNQYMPHLPR